MIMTKEKARELSKIASGRMAGLEALPQDGTYVVATTNDAETIRELAAGKEVEYVLMGTFVPAEKAAVLSELLQDESGFLPSPVVLLMKEGAKEGVRPSLSTVENRMGSIMHEASNKSPTISIREIEIIPGRHEVKVSGTQVILTFSEFRILQTLAAKPGWVFSRDQIIHAIHGDDYNCTERAVDVQVTGLRKKLGEAGRYIETVRGVGYRFAE